MLPKRGPEVLRAALAQAQISETMLVTTGVEPSSNLFNLNGADRDGAPLVVTLVVTLVVAFVVRLARLLAPLLALLLFGDPRKASI